MCGYIVRNDHVNSMYVKVVCKSVAWVEVIMTYKLIRLQVHTNFSGVACVSSSDVRRWQKTDCNSSVAGVSYDLMPLFATTTSQAKQL